MAVSRPGCPGPCPLLHDGPRYPPMSRFFVTRLILPGPIPVGMRAA